LRQPDALRHTPQSRPDWTGAGTPLANALSVWLQIPDARLLIADVDGHQSLILLKCAFEAEARFLGMPTSVGTTTLCAN
jgi:hypothetical protein